MLTKGFTMPVHDATPHVTVRDVMETMENAYPLSYAEKWDHPGIICGDPEQPVTRIAFAVDLTPAVLDAAIDSGADMVITHHPVLFQAVHTVAATTPKGKLIHRAIQHNCALYCAHTNADNALPGVNDALAETLGLTVQAPLIPLHPDALDRWVVHVPGSHVPAVQEAVFTAGAGALGDYTECSFRVDGTGQFRPASTAQPYIGEVGELESVLEARIEFVAPRHARATIKSALLAAHPYEEPSYDILESQSHSARPGHILSPGTGRIGILPEPLSLREFTDQVAAALPATVWGVRAAGDPEQLIRTVAVCGGSGGSFLEAATAAGVDCYVTSDLRHHSVDDHLQAGGPAVIDTAHATSEYPWLHQVADLLSHELGVEIDILPIITDPWTVHSTH